MTKNLVRDFFYRAFILKINTSFNSLTLTPNTYELNVINLKKTEVNIQHIRYMGLQNRRGSQKCLFKICLNYF